MFTGYDTMERTQESKSDHLFNSDDSVLQNLLCAWCLSEQGIPAGEGSHGICRQHANWLLFQQKERQRRRALANRSTSKYVADVDLATRAS